MSSFDCGPEDRPAPGGLCSDQERSAHLDRMLRQEAGETVRVTSVSPGFVRTDFADLR